VSPFRLYHKRNAYKRFDVNAAGCSQIRVPLITDQHHNPRYPLYDSATAIPTNVCNTVESDHSWMAYE
jgi:hypothetical protein